MKKITDKKVLTLLAKVNNGDEEALNKLLEALVCVLLDIRTEVKKSYSEVYTTPTDNSNDIIVGGCSINNTETR
jgi:hypothetical protein